MYFFSLAFFLFYNSDYKIWSHMGVKKCPPPLGNLHFHDFTFLSLLFVLFHTHLYHVGLHNFTHKNTHSLVLSVFFFYCNSFWQYMKLLICFILFCVTTFFTWTQRYCLGDKFSRSLQMFTLQYHGD